MSKPILSRLIAGTMKWGVWGEKFSTNQFRTTIEQCVALGITTFDHADIYGNYTTEEDFGKALLEEPSLRRRIQLVTKCGIRIVTPNRPDHKIKSYDTSKQHIIDSTERSLKNFHTDFIDLLLIHRPDQLMDPDEIAEAFAILEKQGKVLHFGVSNFTSSQTEMILSRFPIVANQIEISVLRLDPFLDGTLDQCITEQLIPMAWSPLGGGNIFSHSEDNRSKRIIAVAKNLSEKYHVHADQVLLNWLTKHPSGIIPVLGTSRIERMKSAIESLSFSLSREEWFMLWRASTGKEVP